MTSTRAVQCNQAVQRKPIDQRKGASQLRPPDTKSRTGSLQGSGKDGGTTCRRTKILDGEAGLPPATNPHQTSALWRRVRIHKAMDQDQPSYLRGTKVSAARRNAQGTGSRQPRNATLNTPPASSATREGSTSEPQSELQSAASSKTLNARVTDKDFRTVTLPAHGISVMESKDCTDMIPYEHFEVESPPPGSTKEQIVQWYQVHHGRKDSQIWLSLDINDATPWARVYEEMVRTKENEAKFAHYGKIAFFQQDIFEIRSFVERKRTTYFTIEWLPKPDRSKHLHCPPIHDERSKELAYGKKFGFENKPDLTYWLPHHLINPAHRDKAEYFTYIMPAAKVIAPYFTVEFKKDDQDLESAVNQLAAASSVALYNRVLLRASRLLANGFEGIWSPEQFKEIAHYGIAFNANRAYVFQALPCLNLSQPEPASASPSHSTPDSSGAWKGCTLYCRSIIEIESPEKVIELRAWVNEIQNWGLGVFADEVLRDIRGLLRTMKGMRDHVSLLPEEIARLGID